MRKHYYQIMLLLALLVIFWQTCNKEVITITETVVLTDTVSTTVRDTFTVEKVVVEHHRDTISFTIRDTLTISTTDTITNTDTLYVHCTDTITLTDSFYVHTTDTLTFKPKRCAFLLGMGLGGSYTGQPTPVVSSGLRFRKNYVLSTFHRGGFAVTYLREF